MNQNKSGKKLIVFGIGQFTELLSFCIAEEAGPEIAAYTVDRQFLTENEFLHKPVIDFEDAKTYDPSEYEFFLALGYGDMNTVREKKYLELKKNGYSIYSFVSKNAYIASNVTLGEGNIILEHTFVAPFSTIGNCNIIWSGCNISHHAEIGNNNFFSPSVCIAGNVTVKNNCFLGANSTIRNGLKIADFSLVGAGVNLTKSTNEKDVLLSSWPYKSSRKSTEIKL